MTKTLKSYGTGSYGPRAGYSKLDMIMDAMPDEDEKILRSWLRDTAWTHNAIADALSDWAKDSGKRELKASHGVVMRWREINEVGY